MDYNKTEDAECWLDISGFNGKYKISNFGNVASFTGKKSGNLMKCYIQNNCKSGHKRYYLFKDGKVNRMAGHRLVAVAFISNPKDLPEVNHIDNDRTNNYYKNLEWVTRKENCEHAAKQKRYNIAKGENSPHAKLTMTQVLKIRKSSDSRLNLSIIYNVSVSTISDIVLRRSWDHVK